MQTTIVDALKLQPLNVNPLASVTHANALRKRTAVKSFSHSLLVARRKNQRKLLVPAVIFANVQRRKIAAVRSLAKCQIANAVQTANAQQKITVVALSSM